MYEFGRKGMRPTAATARRTKCSNRPEHEKTTTNVGFLQSPLEAWEKVVAVCTIIALVALAWFAIDAANNAIYWFIVNVLGNPCGWAV